MKSVLSTLAILALATPALSVCGIHSFTTCDDGITHWFDPLTGEICDPLDCGGGRAPPKTIPGCPAYSGTETRATSASYLSCWKPSEATTTPTLATSTTKVTETGTTQTGSASTGAGGTTAAPTGTAAGTTTRPTGSGTGTSTGTGAPAATNAGNVVGAKLMAVVAGAALGAAALI